VPWPGVAHPTPLPGGCPLQRGGRTRKKIKIKKNILIWNIYVLHLVYYLGIVCRLFDYSI
jgi:hypothetical protein